MLRVRFCGPPRSGKKFVLDSNVLSLKKMDKTLIINKLKDNMYFYKEPEEVSSRYQEQLHRIQAFISRQEANSKTYGYSLSCGVSCILDSLVYIDFYHTLGQLTEQEKKGLEIIIDNLIKDYPEIIPNIVVLVDSSQTDQISRVLLNKYDNSHLFNEDEINYLNSLYSPEGLFMKLCSSFGVEVKNETYNGRIAFLQDQISTYLELV